MLVISEVGEYRGVSKERPLGSINNCNTYLHETLLGFTIIQPKIHPEIGICIINSDIGSFE